MLKKWKLEDLKSVVESSVSIKEVCEKLNLNPDSSSRQTVVKYINKLNIDRSHFLSNKQILDLARNNSSKKKRTFEELFSINSLDRQYIKKEFQKYVENACKICGLFEWCGKNIVLHLDHINGDRCDNRFENLRLICPNCHSQTDTYCGKNTKIPAKVNKCNLCSKEIYRRSKLCKSCAAKTKNGNFGKFKIDWPKDIDLMLMINESNVLQVSKKLNVSYNAIVRRLKSRGLKK